MINEDIDRQVKEQFYKGLEPLKTDDEKIDYILNELLYNVNLRSTSPISRAENAFRLEVIQRELGNYHSHIYGRKLTSLRN
jgi:hypothetical protein